MGNPCCHRLQFASVHGTPLDAMQVNAIWGTRIGRDDPSLRHMAGEHADSWTWYSVEEDMRRISRMFQDVLFTMDITGEEGYRARHYFLDGKCQTWTPDITPEEFDRRKLQ